MNERVPREVVEEILLYQENSDLLAMDPSDGPKANRAPVETTTISFRLPKEEAERIARIADERGWSVSVLIRSWIQRGQSVDVPADIRDALNEFESSYSRLRHALILGIKTQSLCHTATLGSNQPRVVKLSRSGVDGDNHSR